MQQHGSSASLDDVTEQQSERVQRQLRRLAPTKDWASAADRWEDEPEAPAAADSSAPQRNRLTDPSWQTVVHGAFTMPQPAALSWPTGQTPVEGVTTSPGSELLGFPLRRVHRLVQVVYDWVGQNRSGRIDWEAVARQASVARPGEAPPPLLSASDAHRLWRLIAYRMAAPGRDLGGEDDDAQGDEDLLAVSGAERGRPPPPSALEDVGLDADSDFEDFTRTLHPRDGTPAASRARAARAPLWPASGTPRLVGRCFPRPPGAPRPVIPEDGSGPIDLGFEPPRKVRKHEHKKEHDDDYTLQQALKLRVQSKPWDEAEDRKLTAAVLKHAAGRSDFSARPADRAGGLSAAPPPPSAGTVSTSGPS